MVKLIDKDALVAEIERLYDEKGTFYAADVLYYLKEWLDTLEVKEVDLRKELNDFIEQQKAWIKDNRVVEYDNGDSFNHIYDLEVIAKHFFELGLKAKQYENV